jgi:hypothetical protein
MTTTSRQHLHAYWALIEPVGPDEAERGNRRLGRALGADLRSVDAARVLRPPGTRNHKPERRLDGEAPEVAIERMIFEVFRWGEVVGHLSDAQRSRPTAPTASPHDDDPLKRIPARMYVEHLTGAIIGRNGKTHCPLPDHDDGTASFQVYDEGWKCFGCPDEDRGEYPGRGGDVYTLAAHLWALDPIRDFAEIRWRLLERLRG